MKHIATALAALVLSLPAQAAMHIYEFTGSVSSLGDIERMTYLDSSEGTAKGSVITLGDRFVGRFSYDASATPFAGSSWAGSASASYSYSTPASASSFFAFTILPSGQTVSTSGAGTPWRYMNLNDGYATKPYTQDELTISGNGYGYSPFGVRFVDTSATWLSGGKLPEQLSLADMTSARVYHTYYRADGHNIMLGGEITSLTNLSVTAVPEPGTWAMLVAGLGILGLSARRKRA